MCTNPNRAFDTGYLTEKGKPLYKICGPDVDFIHKPLNQHQANQKHPKCYDDMIIRSYKLVRCGKCWQCRLDYTRVWAIRCYLEATDYKFNYMVTLTYNDENVPVSEKTGEKTLRPKDCQDFMKRLRTEWSRRHNHGIVYAKNLVGDFILDEKRKKIVVDPGIRYFLAGEYGGDDEYTDRFGQKRKGTKRPHYHFIGFNLPVYDLKPLFINELGQQVYYSAELTEIWGMGHVTVVECNWNTCAYVARYILKKQKGPSADEYYSEKDIVPEFTLCSLKPGIAQKYYEKHKEEIFNNDEIVIEKLKIDKYGGVKKEIVRVKPPKYFIDLYEKEKPEFVAELKKQRELGSKKRHEEMMSKTEMNEIEYLKEGERKLREKMVDIRRKFLQEVRTS